MNSSPIVKTFTPSVASPPGDTLQELLTERGMTQIELASRLGLDKKTINLIVSGNAALNEESAIGLERVFDIPAQFWLNLESQYQIVLARKAQLEKAKEFKEWVSKFMYADFVKRDWVKEVSSPRAYAEKAINLLNFFGVSDPDGWKAVYQDRDLGLSYRKSVKVSVKTHAISAWLRAGEIESQEIEAAAFDVSKFREALKEIRKLTILEDPKEIVGRIQALCAEAGVLYVVVRELPGLGINGVMRWYCGRPLIQQSFRMKWNDQFWFTFFHEAGHVLQNRKKQTFIDAVGIESDDKEREDDANRFAADILLNEKDYNEFLDSCDEYPDERKIRAFAKKVGIHAGIIVGRLMRDDILDYSDPALGLKCQFHDQSA